VQVNYVGKKTTTVLSAIGLETLHTQSENVIFLVRRVVDMLNMLVLESDRREHAPTVFPDFL
jgi:hypothetical protein